MKLKLFTRNEHLDRYQKDCIEIWKYINEKGIPNFTFNDVERLWDAYSDSACASWLIVHSETLEGFLDWLEE